MTTLFLVLIYVAFICLGLPDSLLGTAWPLMHNDFGVSTDSAGIIFICISACTIVSSMMSSRVIRRFGTGPVTLVSVLLTAVSLLLMSFNTTFVGMVLLSLPLGIGAGAIDSGLNEFVAEHYSSRQMSWLHCFWGLGATGGPIVLASLFAKGVSWHQGYLIIAIVLFVMAGILVFSLPFWKHFEGQPGNAKDAEKGETEKPKSIGLFAALKIKGAPQAMFTFFCYCAAEQGMCLWGATYLIMVRGLSAATAASWVSIYYFSITLGRFINGLLTARFSNTMLIRAGQVVLVAGAIMLILPLPPIFSLIAIFMYGMGCAPIYPCMLQETPVRFSKEHAQDIMGYQMGIAYAGTSFLPPLIGKFCTATSMQLLPVCLLLLGVIMLVLSERLNKLLNLK